MKRKKCVDYISRFVLFCLCLSVFWCLQHQSGKCSPLSGEFFGVGGAGNPYDFCIKLWILTRLYIWTLGFGKQS